MIEVKLDYYVEECPLCGRKQKDMSRRSHRVPVDEDVFKPNRDLIYKTCFCGLIYAGDYMTDEAARAYYQDGDYRSELNGERGISSSIKEDESTHVFMLSPVIFRWIDKCQNALDIGCSSGTMLESLRDHYGCSVTGLEWNWRIRDHVNEKGIYCVEEFDQLPGKYDLIVLSHVLEHTIDPAGLLNQIKPYLADGGKLVVQVPIMMPGIPHPILFTEAGAAWTLIISGFKLLAMDFNKHMTMLACT